MSSSDYQNHEQRWQKLAIFLENKVFRKSTFSKKRELERFDQFSTLKNDFENQNFDMFEKVVHNFGKSAGDSI